MPWRMAVLQFILYITMKRRHNEGYTIFIGGRLGRREKAKQGNLLDCIKSETETCFFYVGGHRIVNN